MEYDLNDKVLIVGTTQSGVVRGRAEYVNSPPRYLVRHVSGLGNLIEEWYEEDVLELKT